MQLESILKCNFQIEILIYNGSEIKFIFLLFHFLSAIKLTYNFPKKKKKKEPLNTRGARVRRLVIIIIIIYF
jgi:hypothetical protein